MAIKTVRRSISMTPEMRDLLAQITAKHGRDVTEADIIRDAIRQYLDEQAAVLCRRRHFQKSLQARLDTLETTLTFHLHILISLLAMILGDESGAAIDDAIIAAKREGKSLTKRITAVRVFLFEMPRLYAYHQCPEGLTGLPDEKQKCRTSTGQVSVPRRADGSPRRTSAKTRTTRSSSFSAPKG